MVEFGGRARRVAVATTTACVVAVGGAACGDSGDSDASRGDGERQRVAAVVEGMYGDLADGDASGVCAAMSSSARAQIARQVPGGVTARPGGRTCEASLSKFIEAAAGSGVLDRTRDARVERVEVDGAQASATVAFGTSKGKIELHRENGRWRLGPGAVGGGG